MEKKSFFSKISSWLHSTEMFARPSKKLPGTWKLFEYYRDLEDELLHITKEKLTDAQEELTINFTEDGNFIINSDLSVSLIKEIENGEWSISKNFVTIIHPKDFRRNVEFQFAFEKENLKLLKKDRLGNIEFFGFFRNTN